MIGAKGMISFRLADAPRPRKRGGGGGGGGGRGVGGAPARWGGGGAPRGGRGGPRPARVRGGGAAADRLPLPRAGHAVRWPSGEIAGSQTGLQSRRHTPADPGKRTA